MMLDRRDMAGTAPGSPVISLAGGDSCSICPNAEKYAATRCDRKFIPRPSLTWGTVSGDASANDIAREGKLLARQLWPS
jgi:hypothetical protein